MGMILPFFDPERSVDLLGCTCDALRWAVDGVLHSCAARRYTPRVNREPWLSQQQQQPARDGAVECRGEHVADFKHHPACQQPVPQGNAQRG